MKPTLPSWQIHHNTTTDTRGLVCMSFIDDSCTTILHRQLEITLIFKMWNVEHRKVVEHRKGWLVKSRERAKIKGDSYWNREYK